MAQRTLGRHPDLAHVDIDLPQLDPSSVIAHRYHSAVAVARDALNAGNTAWRQISQQGSKGTGAADTQGEA